MEREHCLVNRTHGLEDYLRSMISTGTWYWSHESGQPSFLSGPKKAIQDSKYLQHREIRQVSTEKYA